MKGVAVVDSWGLALRDLSGRLTPLLLGVRSHIRVLIPSSSIVCSLINALNIFLTVLMHLSHTPPWWEPAGGLNVHLIFFCKRDS